MTNLTRSVFSHPLPSNITRSVLAAALLSAAAVACGGGGGAGNGEEGTGGAATEGPGPSHDGTSELNCNTLSVSDPEPTVRALATADGLDVPMALDEKYIYAQKAIDKEHRYLLRLDRGDGTVEVIAPTEPIDSMVVDEESVYLWGRYSGVFKISKDGNKPELLVPWEHVSDFGLAVDDKNIYMVDEGGARCDTADGSLYGFDKRTGKPTLTVKGLTCPASVASDGRYVYVSEAGSYFRDPNFKGSIKRVPTGGGATEVLAQGFKVGADKLILNGEYVYFTEVARANDVPPGSAVRVPKNGGDTERLWGPCTSLSSELLGVVDDDLIYSSMRHYTRLNLTSKQDYDISVDDSDLEIFSSVSIMDGNYIYALTPNQDTLYEIVRQ
jgi:hypothetical protein